MSEPRQERSSYVTVGDITDAGGATTRPSMQYQLNNQHEYATTDATDIVALAANISTASWRYGAAVDRHAISGGVGVGSAADFTTPTAVVSRSFSFSFNKSFFSTASQERTVVEYSSSPINVNGSGSDRTVENVNETGFNIAAAGDHNAVSAVTLHWVETTDNKASDSVTLMTTRTETGSSLLSRYHDGSTANQDATTPMKTVNNPTASNPPIDRDVTFMNRETASLGPVVFGFPAETNIWRSTASTLIATEPALVTVEDLDVGLPSTRRSSAEPSFASTDSSAKKKSSSIRPARGRNGRRKPTSQPDTSEGPSEQLHLAEKLTDLSLPDEKSQSQLLQSSHVALRLVSDNGNVSSLTSAVAVVPSRSSSVYSISGSGLLREEIATVGAAVAGVALFWTLLALVTCIGVRAARNRKRRRRLMRNGFGVGGDSVENSTAVQSAMMDAMIRAELARGRMVQRSNNNNNFGGSVITRAPTYVNVADMTTPGEFVRIFNKNRPTVSNVDIVDSEPIYSQPTNCQWINNATSGDVSQLRAAIGTSSVYRHGNLIPLPPVQRQRFLPPAPPPPLRSVDWTVGGYNRQQQIPAPKSLRNGSMRLCRPALNLDNGIGNGPSPSLFLTSDVDDRRQMEPVGRFSDRLEVGIGNSFSLASARVKSLDCLVAKAINDNCQTSPGESRVSAGAGAGVNRKYRNSSGTVGGYSRMRRSASASRCTAAGNKKPLQLQIGVSIDDSAGTAANADSDRFPGNGVASVSRRRRLHEKSSTTSQRDRSSTCLNSTSDGVVADEDRHPAERRNDSASNGTSVDDRRSGNSFRSNADAASLPEQDNRQLAASRPCHGAPVESDVERYSAKSIAAAANPFGLNVSSQQKRPAAMTSCSRLTALPLDGSTRTPFLVQRLAATASATSSGPEQSGSNSGSAETSSDPPPVYSDVVRSTLKTPALPPEAAIARWFPAASTSSFDPSTTSTAATSCLWRFPPFFRPLAGTTLLTSAVAGVGGRPARFPRMGQSCLTVGGAESKGTGSLQPRTSMSSVGSGAQLLESSTCTQLPLTAMSDAASAVDNIEKRPVAVVSTATFAPSLRSHQKQQQQQHLPPPSYSSISNRAVDEDCKLSTSAVPGSRSRFYV